MQRVGDKSCIDARKSHLNKGLKGLVVRDMLEYPF